MESICRLIAEDSKNMYAKGTKKVSKLELLKIHPGFKSNDLATSLIIHFVYVRLPWIYQEIEQELFNVYQSLQEHH